jgi:N-acetylglucosamine-6-sulfatase
MSRFLTAILIAGFAAHAVAAESAPRPNVVFILMDDLRWDELGCTGHPFLKTPNVDRLAREGALFRNFFATTPLCSPSRASFLTGLYPHAHGVTDNTDHDALSHRLATFLRLMHDAGYTTAFIGKWHMGTDDSPRPGIDHWIGFKGQGEYIDPVLNIDGKMQKVPGYATDILDARAVEFIRRPHDKPFVLYLSHKAMHPNLTQRADGSLSDPSASTFVPAPRHAKLFANEKIPRRPNALVDHVEGKPALMRKIDSLPPLSRATGSSDKEILGRERTFMAAEEGVGDILKALAEKKLLDNTLVIFTSDHGDFYGEHGLSVERRLAYEEGIRIPLVMRYPRLIKAATVIDQMVLSIDIAPTLLQLAGTAIPKNLHGRSLVPLLKGEPVKWRDSFLVEYFSDKVFPRMDHMGYQAVRTDRWKLIHYTDLKDMDELYDLQTDPYEMHNRIDDPSAKAARDHMRDELHRQLQATAKEKP